MDYFTQDFPSSSGSSLDMTTSGTTPGDQPAHVNGNQEQPKSDDADANTSLQEVPAEDTLGSISYMQFDWNQESNELYQSLTGDSLDWENLVQNQVDYLETEQSGPVEVTEADESAFEALLRATLSAHLSGAPTAHSGNVEPAQVSPSLPQDQASRLHPGQNGSGEALWEGRKANRDEFDGRVTEELLRANEDQAPTAHSGNFQPAQVAPSLPTRSRGVEKPGVTASASRKRDAPAGNDSLDENAERHETARAKRTRETPPQRSDTVPREDRTILPRPFPVSRGASPGQEDVFPGQQAILLGQQAVFSGQQVAFPAHEAALAARQAAFSAQQVAAQQAPQQDFRALRLQQWREFQYLQQNGQYPQQPLQPGWSDPNQPVYVPQQQSSQPEQLARQPQARRGTPRDPRAAFTPYQMANGYKPVNSDRWN